MERHLRCTARVMAGAAICEDAVSTDCGSARAFPKASRWGMMRRLAVFATALVAALVFTSVAWARPAAAPGSLPGALHQSCLPDGTIRVAFGWTPSYGGSQWLDLSLADNGFAPGTYVSVGPLASYAGSFAWDGIAPGQLHVARVNTLTVLGWEPSQTNRFVTRTCSTSSAAQLASVFPEQQCSGTVMTFQWAPANPEGQVQWIDLSTTDDGFAPGTYAHAGPFSGAASSFSWTGLQQGARHYWRVNTWTGSQWTSSAAGSFSTTSPQPAATGDAERILAAAVRTIKGRDLPVFLPERSGREGSVLGTERAIALGGTAYFGTYDGCLNQITVVQAPGGDGSLIQLVEPMTALPATLSQAQAQLEQLFPGAGPVLDRGFGAGPDGDTIYLFQGEVATISYSILILGRGGNVDVRVIVVAGSGSYKGLVGLEI
jgi:hypothetical protein